MSLRESAAFTRRLVPVGRGLQRPGLVVAGQPGRRPVPDRLRGRMVALDGQCLCLCRHFPLLPGAESRNNIACCFGASWAPLMRLGFILAGAALIRRFDFVLPLFGLFLLYAAWRLAWHSTGEIDPQQNSRPAGESSCPSPRAITGNTAAGSSPARRDTGALRRCFSCCW